MADNETQQTKLQEYTLRNKNGISVGLLNYGATLRSIVVPDRYGIFDDILLGFKDIIDYIKNPPYFGGTIGRVANRIAFGKFSIDGQDFELPCNENGINHHHGGFKGFDKVFWDSSEMEDDNSISFYLKSLDGDQGYPGELDASVHYLLTDEDELKVAFKATVKDKATIVNLTSHPYFNLAGVQTKCNEMTDHLLEINANSYLPVDKNLVPTGERCSVSEDGGTFDFQQPKLIGDALSKVPGGNYDHTFCKSRNGAFAASLYHPGSGRFLEVFSSQPGTHIYTPDFTCGSLIGKHGSPYKGRSGLAIENQNFPNAVNLHFPPTPILRPGDLYEQLTTYRFSKK
ncbi:galactose mutarotase-like [Rhopilema esculentum]|uniref:galactose mutarotase-like n=1 Tax=Rhopilema esculentum TaxID=499914 RepID=UPI0031D23B9C